MLSLDHTWFISILGLTPIYFLMFWLRKDIRRKMLSLSILGAIAGPVSQYWYLQDYWVPKYTLGKFGFVEDLLFAFFVLGISGGVINILLRVKSTGTSKIREKWLRGILIVAVLIVSLLFFTDLCGLNSIYASMIGFVILTSLIWYQRSDLIKASIVGMIFWVVLTGIGYNVILVFWPTIFQEWWIWQNISKTTFLNIPIEEFLWFGGWGLMGSVIYEWRGNYYFVPINSS